MRAKFEVGAEIDFLTQAELRKELQGWLVEISRGIRFRQFSGYTQKVGGVWTIATEDRQNTLGPEPGFLWSVTTLDVSGDAINVAADTYAVYVDEVAAMKRVRGNLIRDTAWDVGVLVLDGGSQLCLSGAATGAGSNVYVSGRAAEVPVQLAWQLL